MSSADSLIPKEVGVSELITELGKRNFLLGVPDQQDYSSHHAGFWNGMLQAFALSMYVPEYAQARFEQMRGQVRDPTFFRDFHRQKAREVVEEFPL